MFLQTIHVKYFRLSQLSNHRIKLVEYFLFLRYHVQHDLKYRRIIYLYRMYQLV